MAFDSAFQPGAFQVDAFQIDPRAIGTHIVELPVNCVLAGQQPYKESGRTWEIPPQRRTETPSTMRSGVRRLRGGSPSFTTKTSTRGYD